MRSNCAITKVHSGLKNQSQCARRVWKSLVHIWMCREGWCAASLLSCCSHPSCSAVLTPYTPQGRSGRRIPVLPSSSNATWTRPWHQRQEGKPGAPWRSGTTGTADAAPRAGRDRSGQGMLGVSSCGGKKIAHIICCRLRAKSCSFYLQPLTWTRLLIWVKETRLWPPDNFKVLGFMLLASLRNVCKCWRALLDFRS